MLASLREVIMKTSRLTILTSCLLGLTVVIWLTCLELLSHQSFAAEPSRIVDGSSVIVMYRIAIRGDERSEAVYFGQFVQGHYKLLPVLEREVKGMKPGDEKKVELAPEEGFGPYDEKKKKTVSRTELPAGAHEGDVIEDPTGKEMTVTQLSGKSAVVDYNHPLAGKPLSVKILILEVKDPS